MRDVLMLRAYRRLLVAYTLNELAWAIGSVALALLVYRRTGSAAGATAYFLAAQFVPAFIAPAVVGRVDRLPVRAVLPALYGGEALAFLALGRLATSFSLVPVLLLTIVDGVMALAARSLARATTAAVTSPRGLLREANALTNGSFSICFMIGPAIGGVIVGTGGTAAALLVNSALFALIALSLASAGALPGASRSDKPNRGRLRAALAYARRRPGVRWLLTLQAAAIVFFTISIPAEVVLAQHVLQSGAGGYGALLSAWGAGAIAGSAAYAGWRRLSQVRLIALGAGLLGAGFLVMGLAPTVAVALGGAAIGGAGNGIEMVAARTALQEQISATWMAIVMSLNESIVEAAPGLGILAGGALTALAGPRAALVVGAAGALTIPVWVLAFLRRRRRAPAAAVVPEPVEARARQLESAGGR